MIWSPVPNSNDPDPIAKAAAWVARLNAEDASEADWLALEAWLAARGGRRAAYHAAEMLWAEVGADAVVIDERLRSAPLRMGKLTINDIVRVFQGRWLWAAAPVGVVLLAVVIR